MLIPARFPPDQRVFSLALTTWAPSPYNLVMNKEPSALTKALNRAPSHEADKGTAADTTTAGLLSVRPWVTHSTDLVADCRVFSVHRQLSSRSPDEHETHSFYIVRPSNWVNVIPITEDGKVVLNSNNFATASARSPSKCRVAWSTPKTAARRLPLSVSF